MDNAIKIRAKCRHFRVLIIGRANAGKTTILKKVCQTTDNPGIYDPRGREIDMSKVEPTGQRGHHDIDNQMIFASNPKFIFHDSRGFEAGSEDELQIVKSFIESRAKMTSMEDQLHAIWYCIPTDNARPLLAADEVFFKECGTGRVPVVVIFTKYDALVTAAFNTLREKHNKSRRDAKQTAPDVALSDLKTKYVDPLLQATYKPKTHVRLSDMHKESAECSDLINETANAIDDDILKLLFVSVQQNNLELCIEFAVRRLNTIGLNQKFGGTANPVLLIAEILAWFPHIWRNWVSI